jgi:hypothetical protein
MQFTALLHHITAQLLVQTFYALRRDAAVSVTTWVSRTVVVPTEAVGSNTAPDGQEANACDAAGYSG